MLTVCVDISKESFNWERPDSKQGVLAQDNVAIKAWLLAQLDDTRKGGYSALQIVCESTSGYHKRLLRFARSMGCVTALVSAEQVKALQVVESNDTGKSDLKDPRTMLLLVQLGKTLVDRHLTGEWAALRELNVDYEHIEHRSTQAKNRIHTILIQLFPDLSFKSDWLFDGPTARRVLATFGFDPHAILAVGTAGLHRILLKKHVQKRTIERLWNDAAKSVLQPTDALWRQVKVRQLRDAFEDLTVAQNRRQTLRTEMCTQLVRLQEKGEVKLMPHRDLIGPFMLARILAETGPMRDFQAVGQILRYAGMNLRMKQSGQHRGQERQAKRGRARLRSVVAQAVLKLVVRGHLYGKYYHEKKAAGMPGPVALTAVARKFLKLLFGLERSHAAFDPSRVFTCENQYARAA